MIVVGDGLITAARQGVPHTLERLFAMVRPSLFRFLYRMVANREDAEDLLQDCWIRAEKGVQTFRGGTANIKCWWLGIASNLAVDHLRSRKSWRVEAQIIGEEELASHPEEVEKLAATMSDPGFRYEVSEHAALCFACVGRTLDPVNAAALLLREVFEFTNLEAASALKLSEPIWRHRLESARADERSLSVPMSAHQ